MFDSIRKHQRLLQFLLLLLIFPAFAFFGVSGYDKFLSDDDSVARVDGGKILRQEFDQAMRRQIDQMRQVLGDQIDAKMLDTPNARKEVLDGLITQRVLQTAAAERHLGVSDARLRNEILEIPGLKKPDGAFDMERYQSLLRAQGLNEALFESQMRRDMTIRVLPEAVSQTAFMPKAVIDRVIQLQEESREVRELVFKPSDHLAKLSPTEEQLRKHYEDNPRSYETRESAKIEYVVLSAEDLARAINLAEDDLRNYYTQNKARYTTPEQRQASHILIKLEQGANAQDREKAMAKIKAIQAQLKTGGDFGALAKAQSQDPGSAAKGGDLGLFPRDAMVKAFADAAFAMKVGETSDIVESEFGLHIIRLTAIQPGAEQAFEKVRPAIEGELKRQQAAKRFAESAEAFTNLVYEQSDSLKPAADRFQLTVQSADGVEKGASAPSPKAVHLNPKVLAALFSADSVRTKRNTEAIDVGGNTLVSARIVEHRPAQKKPFETVRAEVLAAVVDREARRLAKEAGEARLKALQGGEAAPDTLSASKTVARGAPPSVPGEALEAIYRVPAAKLPAWVGVATSDGSYAVYQVLKAIAPSEAQVASRKLQYQSQLNQLQAQQDVVSYLDALKGRAKVTRFESRLAEKGDGAR